MRRSLFCLLMLLLTIPLGVAARFAPLGLPWFWSKYLGSMLWAVALYWLIALLLPRQRAATLAVLSAVIAISGGAFTPGAGAAH